MANPDKPWSYQAMRWNDSITWDVILDNLDKFDIKLMSDKEFKGCHCNIYEVVLCLQKKYPKVPRDIQRYICAFIL